MSLEDEAEPGSSRDIRIRAVREALKLLGDIIRVVDVLAALLVRLL
ncbi:MAG: hypothetical protein KF715_21620 [Candidatus Didemnitutus sp.]|nr:hypothetical protein [Candidatus Didemnitutus sp.]